MPKATREGVSALPLPLLSLYLVVRGMDTPVPTPLKAIESRYLTCREGVGEFLIQVYFLLLSPFVYLPLKAI